MNRTCHVLAEESRRTLFSEDSDHDLCLGCKRYLITDAYFNIEEIHGGYIPTLYELNNEYPKDLLIEFGILNAK